MSPEPLIAFAGKKAIDIAVGKIDKLLQEANDKDKWRVERCEIFLETCSEAIRGLEREYDEILVQASSFQGSIKEAKELRKRINEYLHIDKLRDKLKEAIEGLSFYQEAFEIKAKSIMNWPWKKKDKEEAVNQFAGTLKQLHTYLEKLSNQDLPFRTAGTGIGIEALFSILNQLDRSDGSQDTIIKELSKKYQSERDKEPMFENISRIRVLIEKLHKEFR